MLAGLYWQTCRGRDKYVETSTNEMKLPFVTVDFVIPGNPMFSKAEKRAVPNIIHSKNSYPDVL